MADERIVLEFVGDPSGLKPVETTLEGINNLTKEQADLLKKTGAEAEKLQGSFLKGSEGAKRLEKELNRTPKTLAEMELKLQRLKELLRDDAKIGTQGFKQVTKAIKETESAIDKANGKLTQTKSKGQSLLGTFKKVGLALGVAFGVQQLVQFGIQSVKLAAQGEGIRTAFEKLNNPQLLDGLREATRGAVGDVELMRSAIKAKNFKIPLEQLAGFFEFATKRSIETGESVQFLTESIVNGIGRKSTLVLDNLGISAVELQAEFKKTGDFGQAAANIISKSLAETGDVADTTAIKLARLTNLWGTFSETVGEWLINVGTGWAYMLGLMDTGIDKLDGVRKAQQLVADLWRDGFQGGYRSLTDLYLEISDQVAAIRLLEEELESLGTSSNDRKRRAELLDLIAAEEIRVATLRELFEVEQKRQRAGHPKDEAAIVTISSLNEELKILKDALDETEVGTDAFTAAWGKMNAKAKELADVTRSLAGEAGSLALIRLDLRNLEGQLEKTTAGSVEFWQILDKITAKTKELNQAVAMTNLADALKVDTEDEYSIPDISASVDEFKKQTKSATDFADDAWESHFTDLMNAQDAAAANAEKASQQQLDTFNLMTSSISQAFATVTAMNIQEIEAEQEALDRQLKNRTISEDEYERRSRALRKKRAEAKKEEALFNAIINTATAVTNALAQENYAAAIAAGILGALNIALIASQPVPEFAKGVIGLQGPGTETSDSITAKLSKGESVMTAQETRKHRGALEAMRNNKWDEYLGQQLNLRLFAGGLNIRDDIKTAKRADGIDYDKLAAAFAEKMKFQDGNLIRAIDNHRRTDKDGFVFLAEQLRKNKPRKRGGYA